MRSFLASWRSYFLLTAGSFCSLWISVVVEEAWTLPLLMTLALYPLFLADLILGERVLALRHVLWWALASSVFVILFTRTTPGTMARVVLRGVRYRDEMFQWILTGEGAEGNPRLFIPLHLKHLATVSIASLLTGGLCGLAFGAILLNYMNFYVGSLSLKTEPFFWAFFFGWPIWSLVRVVGFILCGIALAQPLLVAAFHISPSWRSVARWFLMGVLFVMLDICLKWTLAPFWRDLLRHAVRL